MSYVINKPVVANSNVLVRVTLSSGNQAIYDCQPQHVPRADNPASLELPVLYGVQIAHESQGQWFYPGGWDEITDKALCFAFSNM
jgi:hypothetical protein